MMWSEVFSDLMRMLGPIVMVGSRSDGMIRLSTGERLDFYSLENTIVGRGSDISAWSSLRRPSRRTGITAQTIP
jgi:hypothetical protein